MKPARPDSKPTVYQAEDMRQRQLRKRIDEGMETIRRLEREARSDPARLIDVTLEFVRVSDRIRRAIKSSHKLDQAAQARAAAAAAQRSAIRRRIIHEVEGAIRCVADGAEAEALRKSVRERLDSAGLDGEIDCRPVADIIADMLRDLGLAPSRAYADAKAPSPRPAPAPRTVH